MLISRTKIVIFSITVFVFWVFAFGQPASAAQRIEFNVEPEYDYAGRSEVVAFNTHVSDKARFYIERDWWNNLHTQEKTEARGILDNLIAEFNSRIYDVMTNIYGSEWTPGIDNDPRLTVLFVRLKELAGGYFNSIDECPKTKCPRSNEREMVYINLYYIRDQRLKSFLAHEFQHLINFYQKEKIRGVEEDVWLNEAYSEYASTLLGYDQDYSGSNLEKRTGDFLKKPSDSLTEWKNQKYDYGVVNLFMQYLVDHYGPMILTKMMQSDKAGIASINNALSLLGHQKNFSDVFTDWIIANFLNDCSIQPINTYCYLSSNLKDFRVSLNLLGSGASFQTGFMVKDWAGYWYQADAISAPLILKIDFLSDSPTAKFRIPYIIVGRDGSRQVFFVNLKNKNPGQQGTVYVDDFGGNVSSAVTIVSNQYRLDGFTSNDPGTLFYLDFSLTTEMPPPERIPSYADGSLLRAKGDYRVYVIKGRYKRWIQSAEIFNSYLHLRWEDIIEVTQEELDWYQEAWLIRAVDDYKVYEVNADGTKHWLRMTASEFTQSGRDWGMVYLVNQAERDWYWTGADVIFK